MSGQANDAVFLSYASQDAEVARRICEALQAAGVEAWLDEGELVGGAAWDTEIRRRIRDCALFVPLISAHTEHRLEGYFRLEWRLADQRTHLMAKGRPFLVPVAIDGTREDDAHVPDSFLDVQWSRLPDGGNAEAFAAHIRRLIVAADPHADRRDSRPVSITPPTASPHPSAARRRIGAPALTVIAVLLAIGGAALWRLTGGGDGSGEGASARAANPAPGMAMEPGAAATDNTFAVLPFVNLSGDPTQEYFSDGLTEEITSALVRIPDLRVVGRTSAFEFKGKNQDLRSIGQALGARYLLEGSVRKAGDRLRVTAQLIEAGAGVHLWTENYDRKLTDVFAIQEEIAKAIAGALSVPLGLKQGESLAASRTQDFESYQDYLRAKTLYVSAASGSNEQVIEILRRVVARNPDFAPAWATLARAYTVAPGNTVEVRSGSVEGMRRAFETFLQQAAIAAQRAVELNPKLPGGYLALGRLQTGSGNLLSAGEFYAKARALDPDNPEYLLLESNFLALTGRLDEALAMKRRLLVLEPFTPALNQEAATVLWLNGRDEEAVRMARDLPPSAEGRGELLARFLAAQKRFREAADALHEIPAKRFLPGIVAEAERLLRSAPAATPSPQLLSRLGSLNFVYLYVGALDRSLEYHEGRIDAGQLAAITSAELWHPSYAPVRRTERFKALVRKVGLVDYWRARGWPEFCKPVGTGDFSCS